MLLLHYRLGELEMENSNKLLDVWSSLSYIHSNINDKLEHALQHHYGLSLKEFYVLYFISGSEDKKMRLQHVQEMVDLSQSAVSRLVARMEADNCRALQRSVCEDDRRGIYTQITEIGEKKLEGATKVFHEVLSAELGKNNVKSELQSLMQRL